MSAQLQVFIVIVMVVVALLYVGNKAKKRFTANNANCGGCGKCGH